MSTLGDYIYASWSGYSTHGTKRFDSKNSNFDLQIFNEHEKILLEKITADSAGLTPDRIRDIENKYNTDQQKIHDQIKQLLKNKKSNKNNTVLMALLQSFNSQWNDHIAQQIVNDLYWDDAKDTLIYRPSKPLQLYGADDSKSGLPKIANWKPTAKTAQEQIRYLKPLMDSIKALKKALTDNPIYNKSSKSDCAVLNQYFLVLAEIGKTKKSFQGQEITADYHIKNNNYNIAEIRDKANEIRFNYVGIETVNKILQAQFAEFAGNALGQTITQTAYRVSKNALRDTFKNMFIGRSSGAPKQSPNYSIAQLNFKEVALEMKNDKEVASFFEKTEQKQSASDKTYTTYKFTAMGDPRAQKADIVLNFSITGLPNQKVGVSMKNTSLSKGDIKGQNSSLMLYLLGASEIAPDYLNMGTQYLNILSKHGNESDGNKAPEGETPYSQADMLAMREKAQRVLSLHVLYSAFSGYGQLRNQQQGAQLLAIYDKDNQPIGNRVHFYSIPMLVSKIYEQKMENKVLSPAISSFLFNNEYEEKYEDFPRRITKTLIEARRKNISATLRSALLRSLVTTKR